MAAQPLTYLVKIDGLTGNSTIKGYEGYFAIDEFTFGELSQLSNGGGGGGIGKALLDPLVLDFAGMPEALATLLQDATNGRHIKTLDLVGPTTGKDMQKVYDLTLNNVTVAGVAVDGGHDTAIAFAYGSGSETIKGQRADGSLDAGQTATFGASTTAIDHDALAAFAHSHDGAHLTYLVKIDGVNGDSTIKGYEGYFTVDEFTFGELSQLSNGGGGSVGKAHLDPLVLDFSGMPEGLATVLQDAVTGKHIKTVELVGLSTGKDAHQVYDLKLSNVTVAGVAVDGGHDTAVALAYGNGSETIKGQ